MKDFTKEELIMLKNGIQYLSDRTSLSDGYLEAHNATENKIQSMIDNYCEHDFDMTGWINDSSGCRWYECKKCKSRYR